MLSNQKILYRDILEFSEFDADFMAKFFDYLATDLKIIYVNAYQNVIDDNAANKLAQCLKYNTTIFKLDLRDNKMSEHSLAIVLTSLTYNQQLKYLDIGGNHVTKKLLKAFCKFIKYNPMYISSINFWSSAGIVKDLFSLERLINARLFALTKYYDSSYFRNSLPIHQYFYNPAYRQNNCRRRYQGNMSLMASCQTDKYRNSAAHYEHKIEDENKKQKRL